MITKWSSKVRQPCVFLWLPVLFNLQTFIIKLSNSHWIYLICVCVCMCATGHVTVCVCVRSYMRVNLCALIIESNCTWRTVSKTRSRRAFRTNFHWYKKHHQADTPRHTRFACRRRHQMFKTVCVEIRVNYQMIKCASSYQ